MADGSVATAIETARLMLVGPDEGLQAQIATGHDHLFTTPPVVAQMTGGRAALDLLRATPFDIVAADLTALADIARTVEDQIGRIARACGDALLVVIASDSSVSTSLRALQAGAHDCVPGTLLVGEFAERLVNLARRHGRTRGLAGMEPPRPMPADPAIPPMHDLVLPMWRQEQKIIEQAIQSFAGNIALAAAALELSPSTIYRKRQAWAEMDGRRSA